MYPLTRRFRHGLGGLLLVAATLLSGSLSAATLGVPFEYPTVQSAIDAAGTGDVVEVAEGSYFESITLKPGVVVRGHGVVTAATALLL